MPVFKKHQRVYLPADDVLGKIENVVSKAEGPWAEQFYELRLDGNDLCLFTVQENALHAAPGA